VFPLAAPPPPAASAAPAAPAASAAEAAPATTPTPTAAAAFVRRSVLRPLDARGHALLHLFDSIAVMA